MWSKGLCYYILCFRKKRGFNSGAKKKNFNMSANEKVTAKTLNLLRTQSNNN